MRVDSSALSILNGRNNVSAQPSQDRQLSALASKKAAAQLGIREAELPGSYRPIYATTKREIVEDVTEERKVTRTEGVYANQAVTETRAVFTDQAVFETREVYEDRAITETQNVYEEQAVFTDQDVRATQVNGTRALNTYSNISQAGISFGADLSVKVGNGQTAVLRFDGNTRVSLTVGNTTTQFAFGTNGSLGGAVAAALDKIDGLSASLGADGKLKLQTDNAQSLTIDDVANGLLDFSGSPLAALGLTKGTTNSQVVGTERVQTGTQQVLIGQVTVQTGTERVLVGTEQVQTGTTRVQTGTETVVTGSVRVQIGTRTVDAGTETVVVGTRTREIAGERGLVGLERTDFGIGDALRNLASATLPPGYIEALFGSARDVGARAGEPTVRSAYAATEVQGRSWRVQETAEASSPTSAGDIKRAASK